MRKALLKLAKDRFREIQSSHKSQVLDSNLAAPISPTPNLIINTFLPYLKLDSSKLMVDLGCGDGRWLLAASKMTQCRSFGIDLDEDRLKVANQSIAEQSLDDIVEVERRDVFDFVKNDAKVFLMADVFVLYLFRDAMVEMGKLLQERICADRLETKPRAKSKRLEVIISDIWNDCDYSSKRKQRSEQESPSHHRLHTWRFSASWIRFPIYSV
eukprot:scaffold3828_cov110-Skeletonema_dohrnii-CCMP3373.AAC.10